MSSEETALPAGDVAEAAVGVADVAADAVADDGTLSGDASPEASRAPAVDEFEGWKHEHFVAEVRIAANLGQRSSQKASPLFFLRRRIASLQPQPLPSSSSRR
jgi:hypothetical protein